jgi:hypothetical protein
LQLSSHEASNKQEKKTRRAIFLPLPSFPFFGFPSSDKHIQVDCYIDYDTFGIEQRDKAQSNDHGFGVVKVFPIF